MKTKGITIWERHAEKFVMAVAVLLFVGFAAMQFIGEPNAVSTPEGNIAPSDIDDLLEDRARALRAKLSDDADPGVELPDPVPALDQLVSELDRSLSPAPSLKQWSFAVAPSVEGRIGIGKNELLVPEIKAVTRVAVSQTADALADGEVERVPELQEFFPDPDQPHDLNIVLVAAPFDQAYLRRQFRGEDADDPEAVPPSSWYNDRPENIVDVAIEREEFIDGAWKYHTSLDPIPGQQGFRAQLAAGELNAALRDDVLGQLSDPAIQLDVIQPAFYALKNETLDTPEFANDEVDEEALERDEQINTIRDKIKNFVRRRDAKLKRLVEDLGGTRRERDAGRDDRGGGSAGGPGRGGGTGRRAPPGKGGPRDAPGKGGNTGGGFGVGDPGAGEGGPGSGPGSIDRKVEDRLNREIDILENKIDDEYQRLVDLGVDVNAQEQDQSPNPLDTLQGDEVVVMGYDLHAEPGHTYRYRMTVKVFNPFFGKKRGLVEEQEHLAESFTLDSPASDWSDPVRINPSLRVFITRASPPGARGAGPLGRAKAEVYRFYDGRHWMETFTVSAGGYIGGTKEVTVPGVDDPVEVDFRTDLFVLDIVADTDEGNDSGGRGLPDTGPRAKVLLQDLRTGEVLELRDPRTDLMSPDRRDLRDNLAFAESGGRAPPS
jgi:hypothetical protein